MWIVVPVAAGVGALAGPRRPLPLRCRSPARSMRGVPLMGRLPGSGSRCGRCASRAVTDGVSRRRSARSRARFHGRHVLNRYEDGMEKCIGCELCAGVCPARCIYVRGADNPLDDAGLAGRALRLRLRDQLPALHPLRPVRRGVPDRGDHRDEAVRVLVHEPRRRDLHQGRAARRRRRPRPAPAVGAVARRRGRRHERVDARDVAVGQRRVRRSRRLVGRARLRRPPARAGPAARSGRRPT